MSKFKREVHVDLDENKQIVIKRKKKSDGTFSVIGSVIDFSGEHGMTKSRRTRIAQNQEDAELVTKELIRYFFRQNSQSEMRHTEKAVDRNEPLHKAIQVLSSATESIVDPSWGLRTQERSVKYFERHFLDAILTVKDSESLQIQIDEIQKQLIAKAVENKRSKGIRNSAEQSVANECFRAQKVFQYLRDTYPELNLPDVTLSMNVLRSSVMPEQAKSLPDSIVLRFARMIEDTIQTDPCYALAAMLMLCAALRTSEACGVIPDQIMMYDGYAVVPVLYQVQNGKLSEILKTEDSYRTVVLPFWGKHIAEECIRVLKKLGNTVTKNYPLVEAPGTFAGWILKKLKECGLTDEMLEAARNLMREETYFEVFSMDISAYLLRRNCACLDCGHVHTFGLQLAHVGVSAAVRRQQPHALHLAERILEVLPEAAGIHWASRHTGAFPDVGFAAVVPERLNVRANLNGDGNVPDAVLALRGADVGNTLLHFECLPDVNHGAVRFDVLRFQPQKLLATETRSQHHPDGQANPVKGQLVHELLDFLSGEGFLLFGGAIPLHLFCEAHRILADQVVGLCLVEKLKQHPPHLGEVGAGFALVLTLLEELLHMEGFNRPKLHGAEVGNQLAESVAVAVLSGLLQPILIAVEPHVCPLLKGNVLADQSVLQISLEGSDFFLDFLLCFAVKVFELGFAVGLIPAR